jgi:hypothetical protein
MRIERARTIASALLAACAAAAPQGSSGRTVGPAESPPAVEGAAFVGEIRIRSARPETYVEGGEVRACGVVYEAEVLVRLTGGLSNTIEFFSQDLDLAGDEGTHIAVVHEAGRDSPERWTGMRRDLVERVTKVLDETEGERGRCVRRPMRFRARPGSVLPFDPAHWTSIEDRIRGSQPPAAP